MDKKELCSHCVNTGCEISKHGYRTECDTFLEWEDEVDSIPIMESSLVSQQKTKCEKETGNEFRLEIYESVRKDILSIMPKSLAERMSNAHLMDLWIVTFDHYSEMIKAYKAYSETLKNETDRLVSESAFPWLQLTDKIGKANEALNKTIGKANEALNKTLNELNEVKKTWK